MSENKQTIKQSCDETQVSHYCYSFLLHNIIIILLVMMIWNNTAPLLLPHFRSQYGMFNQATSFDQPLLYSNWLKNSANLQNSINVCDGTVTCGWGNDTCPNTPFEDRDDLKVAVDQFCGDTYDSSSTYG